jgi:hypothetical protein
MAPRQSADNTDQAFTQLAQAAAQMSGAAQALANAVDALHEEQESAGVPSPRATGPESESFNELANDYIGDTHRQRIVMVFLYIASLGAVALAAALSIWAADLASRSKEFAVSEFLGRGSAVIVLLVAALGTIWQADRHRRAAAEQLRLARQLRTLPVFIDSVEDASLKDLLRGAMAPRFFPRALDDDDVLREPQWPDPNQVLNALGKGSADGESKDA